MEVDFSSLCADQLERLQKRLKSLADKNVSEYQVAMYVVNDEEAIRKLGATVVQVRDVFNDASKSIEAVYAQALHKVNRILKESINE